MVLPAITDHRGQFIHVGRDVDVREINLRDGDPSSGYSAVSGSPTITFVDRDTSRGYMQIESTGSSAHVKFDLGTHADYVRAILVEIEGFERNAWGASTPSMFVRLANDDFSKGVQRRDFGAGTATLMALAGTNLEQTLPVGLTTSSTTEQRKSFGIGLWRLKHGSADRDYMVTTRNGFIEHAWDITGAGGVDLSDVLYPFISLSNVTSGGWARLSKVRVTTWSN